MPDLSDDLLPAKSIHRHGVDGEGRVRIQIRTRTFFVSLVQVFDGYVASLSDENINNNRSTTIDLV